MSITKDVNQELLENLLGAQVCLSQWREDGFVMEVLGDLSVTLPDGSYSNDEEEVYNLDLVNPIFRVEREEEAEVRFPFSLVTKVDLHKDAGEEFWKADIYINI